MESNTDNLPSPKRAKLEMPSPVKSVDSPPGNLDQSGSDSTRGVITGGGSQKSPSGSIPQSGKVSSFSISSILSKPDGKERSRTPDGPNGHVQIRHHPSEGHTILSPPLHPRVVSPSSNHAIPHHPDFLRTSPPSVKEQVDEKSDSRTATLSKVFEGSSYPGQSAPGLLGHPGHPLFPPPHPALAASLAGMSDLPCTILIVK